MEVSRKLTSNKYPDHEDLLHEVILELYSKEEELINGLINRGELF
jgi:DNA-directed RNA polymerase specialized sigma24 family protein